MIFKYDSLGGINPVFFFGDDDDDEGATRTCASIVVEDVAAAVFHTRSCPTEPSLGSLP
jgi:hypothetical protein